MTNEQLETWAKEIVDETPFEAIEEAFIKARELGRKDVLDRMPSEDECRHILKENEDLALSQLQLLMDWFESDKEPKHPLMLNLYKTARVGMVVCEHWLRESLVGKGK